jgi:hypothetical protein
MTKSIGGFRNGGAGPSPELTTIDSPRHDPAMSTTTMSFALPEAMREYVDQRVRSGQSATPASTHAN